MSAFVINPFNFAKPFDMDDYSPWFWYDAADPATIFSNDAGTTQASVGDDVRYWANKGVGSGMNGVIGASMFNPPTLGTDKIECHQSLDGLTFGNITGINLQSSRPIGVFVVCEPLDTYTTQTGVRVPWAAGAVAVGRLSEFRVPSSGSTSSRNIVIHNANNSDAVTLVSSTRKRFCVFATWNNMGYNEGRVNGAAYATTGKTNTWASGRNAQLCDSRATGGAVRPFFGDVMEIVGFLDSITESDVLAIENYLIDKWNISAI